MAQRQQRMRSLMYHQPISQDDPDKMELIVCGYIRYEADQKLNYYIPEPIVILIFDFFKAAVSMRMLTVKRVISSSWQGKLLEVCFNTNPTLSFALRACRKKKLINRHQTANIMKEYKMLQKIGNHPYINCLHYAWQTKSYIILMHDYYPRGELYQHQKKQKRFKEPVARVWIAQIISAIHCLHSINIWGLDMTPWDFLLDKDCNLCLCKVVVRHSDQWEDTASSILYRGSEYLAPEILEGEDRDEGVDWWTVGNFLYELVLGIPPFYSQNVNDCYRRIQNTMQQYPPFLGNDVKDLIDGLLMKDPKERLGYDGIREHVFFKELDWEKLERKEINVGYDGELDAKESGFEYEGGKINIGTSFKRLQWYGVLMEEENIEYDDQFAEFKTFPGTFVSE